ncbi:MAG TPA: enoyl-CoA hydratase/isomerase family protein [Aliiroseovarius sp.]|nr:enoyl-CoA hydratase/isomerase family protein [Aliiroseovarius sp.]
MADIHIRTEGRAGRITLNRPKALNALTWKMCLEIETALDTWRDDDAVALVIIDAEGDRAFCAGGDIQEMYDTARAGDFGYGRRFWADEYRLNAKIGAYPKPYIAFMQGFTMGGGVGVSCHGSHRIVCETSQIAMPECSIGLVPDVGGSHLLARAPGRLGEYFGLTAARMGPGDALHTRFASHYISRDRWPALMGHLADSGDAHLVKIFADSEPAPPPGPAQLARPLIDAAFAAGSVPEILATITGDAPAILQDAARAMERNSPLSMGATLELIRAARATPGLAPALTREYRFTWRSAEQGDFIEGIRAAIIDKDRNPHWRLGLEQVTEARIQAMLAPLGADELRLEGTTT